MTIADAPAPRPRRNRNSRASANVPRQLPPPPPDLSALLPQVELVPLAELTPAPWNPRTISDERFQNLCRSMSADPAFMALRPILATIAGTIFGGNYRYRGAEYLRWPTVPAIRVDISEQLAQERALRDNGSWGDYVPEDLAKLLVDLRDAGSVIELLGIEDVDDLIKRILPGDDPEHVEFEAAPSQDVTERFMVVIDHLSEAEQAELLTDLTARGYDVRGLLA